ncbi:MAG: glycosyltransferase [Deltaproteobacteria bacterium]|nr:glycosyltransferase [Deltaproteobacteria bacterium]MBF0507429.1 glycosyltransferase [Deltaproteobacteria bacterium]
MRVVFCNKYFFLNGGVEKYLEYMMEQVTALGHTSIPFSVAYAHSWDSEYRRYFLPSPGSSGEPHYADIKLGFTNWLRYVDRCVYSFEARWYLSRLLEAAGPVDIAYVLNIYNYMSPSILHTLKARGIPVVLFLGDYNLLCPSYLFLRDGRPCTLCSHGTYLYGARYCCVKGSLGASALRVLSMYVHKWLRLYELVDAFVVPCRFMQEKLIAGGFPKSRIHILSTPVQPVPMSFTVQKKPYILYFGRISYEKGVDTLIEAVQRLSPPTNLFLIGRSYDGERERIEGLIRPEYKEYIHFLGFKTGEELFRWIAEALFTVVPSRWYDNSPRSVYESFLYETPVLAADIGGIPEQIQDGVTGKLVEPDSVDGLADGLRWMLSDQDRLMDMGRAGKKFVLEECNMAAHVKQLLELFEMVKKNGAR